jgi:Ca2+-transporting ATPase
MQETVIIFQVLFYRGNHRGLVETALVLAVVAANASVGYMIDTQVQKRILALRRATRPRAEVIRDGKRLEVPWEDLVVGDLLVLMPGTYVGADSRIIKASHLKIDESALTGESIPVDKNSLPIRHTGISLSSISYLLEENWRDPGALMKRWRM